MASVGVKGGKRLLASELPAEVAGRIATHTASRHGCRVWTGATNTAGAPVITVERKSLLVRRVVYALAHGECPAGVPITPSCRTTTCVASDHLRPYTLGEHAESTVSDALASRVRRLWKTETASHIAAVTGLSRDHVEKIVHNEIQAVADPGFDHSDRGEIRHRLPHTKLADADVSAARRAVVRGVTIMELADRHGVAFSTMHDAVTAKTFKHVPDRIPDDTLHRGRRPAKKRRVS